MPGTSPARILLLGTNVAGVYTGVTTGRSQPVNAQSQNQLSFYLRSLGTTSGGTILIEEADWDPAIDTPYDGDWSVITTISASTFTGTKQLAYHTTAPAAFGFTRVRISADITGGGTVVVALRMR